MWELYFEETSGSSKYFSGNFNPPSQAPLDPNKPQQEHREEEKVELGEEGQFMHNKEKD